MINIFSSSAKWSEAGIVDLEAPVTITSCGYQKFITKNYSISRLNGRSDYQIIYIVNGKGLYNFDNKLVEVPEGNIIVYPPYVAQIYEYKAVHNTELYWIHMSGSSIKDIMTGLELIEGSIHYVGIQNEFSELFNKIIHELQLQKPMYKYMIEGQFLELISSFSRRKLSLQSNADMLISEDIQHILEMMHRSYNNNYSIQNYADFCNLSLYRFIHKFKHYTGKTPLDYITNIRINTARDLLDNSGFNISEISALVGYDNPLYFSRVFKKITGISPTKYKNQNI